MIFYFDFTIWLKLIRLVAGEPKPHRRRTQYRHLLLTVPLRAVLHAIFFFLDGLLFPGLWLVKIKTPVFLIGHARSGTTLAHRLMCADERFSAFKYYELLLPSLIEKKLVRLVARLDRSLLGRRLERRLQAWEEKNFGPMKHIHKMGLTIPEEDDLVLFSSCASGFWATRMPNLGDLDFFHIDQRPPASRRRLMGFYRQCIRRQLYLNGGNLIHLSKNPTFCGRVESILEAFPDARIAILYRNPYETIPSLLKLLQTSWKLRGDVDAAKTRDSSRAMVELSFESYLHPEEVLSRHPEVPCAVIDYRQLVAEPKATIEKVYADLGMDMSDSYRAALQKEQDKARKHETEHRYSLAEFGLDDEEIHRRLAPLFKKFDWDAAAPAAAK
ncbi:MAG: sulfotransferase [Rhodocyclales bacterium]|nr:sulfotransferase [Rhodocyclales bacterium]